jgi:pimeloyl-ACP methyl ester carboxylesterase
VPNIYLVPGLFGSELNSYRLLGGNLLWIDYIRLAQGQAGRMWLADDGVSPKGGFGKVCTPGRPLPQFYTTWQATLDQQLSGDDYNSLQHGYDWRLHPSDNGDSLANRIRADTTPDEPCTIIGHSMGGLLARFAWRSLGRTGEHTLVRRIITLGTPHWGSYQIEEMWSFIVREIQLIFLLSNVSPTAIAEVPYPPYPTWSANAVVNLTMSWPGCYDLLPSLLQPGATTADPLRSLMYESGNWPAAKRPLQVWLDYARDTTHVALADPSTIPPASILTTLACDNLQTQTSLQSAAALGTSIPLVLDGFGDGVVPTASALLEGSTQVRVGGVGHQDLPGAVARGGQLAALVLAVNPDQPPPTPAQVPAVANQLLGSIPFPDRQTLGYYGEGRYVQVPRDDP